MNSVYYSLCILIGLLIKLLSLLRHIKCYLSDLSVDFGVVSVIMQSNLLRDKFDSWLDDRPKTVGIISKVAAESAGATLSLSVDSLDLDSVSF